MEKQRFSVIGMTCAACANSVESMLSNSQGVSKAEVNFANETVSVEYDPQTTEPVNFKNILKEIGYDLDLESKSQEDRDSAKKERLQQLKNNTLKAGLYSVPVILISMVFMDMPYGNYVMWLLTTPVLFKYGNEFFRTAISQAKHKSANMDTLVALSTSVAYLYSVVVTLFPEWVTAAGATPHVYFESASVIIFFILLGRYFEEKAKAGTASAIKKLMGLQPKTVIVVNEAGAEEEIALSNVQAGDIVLIKPGNKVPVDGKVIEGSGYVDESMLTGEPLPAKKGDGDEVFSGTINLEGFLKIKATKVGSSTVLAQIIQAVEDAQGSKAKVQKLADRISSVFVPTVIVISILTFIAWYVFLPENALGMGIVNMVTVLIIACPCALGLATPTALMVGIGKAAENGILIKNADSLESVKKITTLVLDKTGTITEGKPKVSEYRWLSPKGKEEYASKVLALEKRSSHPLAKAIVNYLESEDIEPEKGFFFKEEAGKGIKMKFGKEWVHAGNVNYLKETGLKIPDNLSASVICFFSETEVLAHCSVEDEIKATSTETIEKLQKKGVEVHMLTGDQEENARKVAKKVGIQHVKSGVLPSEKAEYIKILKNNGKYVAMAGDGINDSAALAEAHVSIAMGTGSDIAIDVADMTIVSSDLAKIPEAMYLSHSILKTVKQNLFWAFIYNVIGIPIAAGVIYPLTGFLLNPMIAGAAMAMSSVSVVMNSLRLKFIKQR